MIEDPEAEWDAMLKIRGTAMNFEVIRTAEAIMRDGLGATISSEAMNDLHWRMSAFVGSRIMREYRRSALMAQTVRVTVTVHLDALGSE